MPREIFIEQLKEQYLIPEVEVVRMNGKFEVKFSSDVRVPTVQELFINLSGLSTESFNGADPRLLSQSQSSQEIMNRSKEINQNLGLI